MWGISLEEVKTTFGLDYLEYLSDQAKLNLKEGLLILDKDTIKVTAKGKFLSDGIASDLFYLNDKL